MKTDLGVVDSQAVSATGTLAAYFSKLSLDDIPTDVKAEAKRFILDMIACVVAAARSEIGPLIRSFAPMFGQSDEASVAGSNQRYTLLSAAYTNGRFGNCMDFEEGYPSGVHFGCGAFAAALALAETQRLSGRDFLLAVIAGYELGGRVSEAAGPYLKIEDGKVVGFSDIWGIATPVVFAAVGAAAKSINTDATLMAQALGIAGSNTPVPIGAKWSTEVDLPNTKYCDTGWCTLVGVFAAISAAAGSTGIPTIMDGERGLFRMAGIQKADFYALTGRLGRRWLLRDIIYKPWPCCRTMHFPLTALSKLLQDHKIAASDVQSITVETNRTAMSERFINPNPANFTSKQFSYPHVMAMMLLGIPSGPDWLASITDTYEEVCRLRNCVKVVEHARASDFLRDLESSPDRVIRRMPSAVSIATSSATYRAETETAWGDPWYVETRWREPEVIQKATRLLPGKDFSDLFQRMAKLEEETDIGFILEVLRDACLR